MSFEIFTCTLHMCEDKMSFLYVCDFVHAHINKYTSLAKFRVWKNIFVKINRIKLCNVSQYIVPTIITFPVLSTHTHTHIHCFLLPPVLYCR
uniref:Uncharacterized protein n=1 Tax=Octopus bimaculoides TaxID=37653 RepID=A0A0L8HQ63_OCTBM